MIDLSQRQSDVLDFVVQAIESRGLPPSYREIGDALGIASTNGVSDHVKALIKKGYLKKLEGGSGKARGLQLTAKSRSMHASDNPPARRPRLDNVGQHGRASIGWGT